jgi:phosphate/sulfate permease
MLLAEAVQQSQALTSTSPYVIGALIIGIGMLFWDAIEVGRNDAANLVNAVLGSRILVRRTAIIIAGCCVIMGATLSSDVIETARKGIFHPELLTVRQLLAVYVSVYIVDTVLLYSYSAFGMPVSTTACLVFELLGAAFSMQFMEAVNWHVSGKVVFAIVCSIFLSGIAAFMIQRAVRGAIRDKSNDLRTLKLHGGWVGGGVMAGLIYFMVLKGMKNVGVVKHVKSTVLGDEYSMLLGVFVLWGASALVIHLLLILLRERMARLLFPVLTVLGMMCMAFAFGQNDLANCASPGLATLHTFKHLEEGTREAAKIPIDRSWLLVCGCLMAAGMFTQNAQRVTRAEVRAGSMGDHVKLWAPKWCIGLAGAILRRGTRSASLAPVARMTPAGKMTHYDTLRACIVMAVAASVIATASSRGLPVSTTYVAFAAVVATGMADRIYQRGDAALKLGRSIWVVFSWFMAAGIAAVAAGVVCRIIFHLGVVGMLITIAVNLIVRVVLKRRADDQAERVRVEAAERMHPEDYALEEE